MKHAGKRLKKYIGVRNAVLMVAILACAVGFSLAVPARASADAVLDGFNRLPSALPDDKYDACVGETTTSCATVVTDEPTQCTTQYSPTRKWGCNMKAGSFDTLSTNSNILGSHQYFTLSGDCINDNCNTDNYAALTQELEVYTYGAPTSGVPLSIWPVNRGIASTDLTRYVSANSSCYGNTVTAHYYQGVDNATVPKGGASSIMVVGCDRSYAFSDVPADAFVSVEGTNIYRAKVKLCYGDANCSPFYNRSGTQVSFHVHTDGARARLGLMGFDSPQLLDVDQTHHGKVTQYATNYIHTQTIRYYFKPQCSKPMGSPFTVEWDDVNYPTPDVQHVPPSAKLFRYDPSNPWGTKQEVRTITNIDDQGMRTFNTENIGGIPNQPYAYMLEIYNINGGNGINVTYPFDSANAFIPCPPPPPGGATISCTSGYVVDPGGHNGYPTRTVIGVSGSDADASHYLQVIRTGQTYVIPNFTAADYRDTRDGRVHLTVLHQWTLRTNGPRYDRNDEWQTYETLNFQSDVCYQATCTVSVSGPVAGRVVEGQDYNLVVTIQNTSPETGLPETYPDDNWDATPPASYHLGFTTTDGVAHNAGTGIAHNGSITFTIPMHADAGTPRTAPSISGYPDYYGWGGIGPQCSTGDYPIYATFSVDSAAASVTLKQNGVANLEDPDSVDYNTNMTISTSASAVRINMSSYFAVNGSTIPPAVGNGDYANGYHDIINGSRPISSVNGGDSYCAYIHTDYRAGLVGPGGPTDTVITDSTPWDASDCDHVENRATFKIYNGSVFAGGDFTPACTGGGELAGWFNNTLAPTYSFGSSTEMSALALKQMIGFATNQSAWNRDPKGLSFANTGVTTSTDAYSPVTGGQFESPGCTYLTSVEPPDTTSGDTNRLPGPSGRPKITPGNDGAYTHTGNVTISDGSIGTGKNVAIFVDGDVYIDNDITFNTGGWTPDNVPSFVLRARGNIYIGPNVHQLDGIYIAQPRTSDATKGSTIYTCSNSDYTPVGPRAIHSLCNDQLLVHGSFVARHVNLMRTYGSLRDDKPTITTASPATYYSPTKICYSEDFNDDRYSCPGTQPSVGWNCVNTDEPGQPYWYDNNLCVDSSSGVSFQWFWGGAGSVPAGWRCMQWPWSTPAIWADNYLCTNSAKFTLSKTDQTAYDGATKKMACTHIYDTASTDMNGGAYLCENLLKTSATIGSVTYNPPASCSNGGTTAFTRRQTCAAEIFDFSPELYLGHPAVRPESNGAAQGDAWSSLSPVL